MSRRRVHDGIEIAINHIQTLSIEFLKDKSARSKMVDVMGKLTDCYHGGSGQVNDFARTVTDIPFGQNPGA